MRVSPFFFLILFAGISIAQNDSSRLNPDLGRGCHGIEKSIVQRIEAIKRKHQNSDVTFEVEVIRNAMKTCGIDIARFGVSEARLDRWWRTGVRAEMGRLLRIIQHDVKYRDTRLEILRYEDLARQLGPLSPESKGIIDLNKDLGALTRKSELESCQPVDLRNEELGEIRDQDSVGWCYAFTAGDLIGYKTGYRVSAFDVAINYYADSSRDIGKTGFNGFERLWGAAYPHGIRDAIVRTLDRGGICLESKLSSEDNGYSTISDNIRSLEEFRKNRNSLGAYCSSSLQSMYPNLPFDEIEEVINSTNQLSFLEALNGKACSPRVEIGNINIVSKHLSQNYPDPVPRTQLLKDVDAQLSKNNIVGIGYDSDYLINVDKKDVDFNHASVIVGRRFNSDDQVCEYLIRNSWGRSCSQYDSRLTCEEGHIWVPKNLLAKIIGAVTYVD